LRIPVIGSVVPQDPIDHCAEFALMIAEALHEILAHLHEPAPST
jgi:hypothetical protein